MCRSEIGDELFARIVSAAMEAALEQCGSRTFDVSGYPMKGWVTSGRGALDTDAALDLDGRLAVVGADAPAK